MIYYTTITTKIGELGLVRGKDGLQKLYLPNAKLTVQKMETLFPNKSIQDNLDEFEEIIEQINEYLNGDRKQFDLPLNVMTSPFHKKVLDTVSQITYGETASYGEIAKRVGNPKAACAVGSANANNPIPLIIPCHRVLAANGKLGGYGGGLELKQFLLDLEKDNR